MPEIGSFIDSDIGTANSGNVAASATDGDTNHDDSIISGFDTVEPTDATRSGDSGSSIPGKRRGRKPGSKNRTTAEKTSSDLSSLEDLLISLHLIGAAIIGSPLVALAEDEAIKLSKAMRKVAAHYDVAMNSKMLAWGNLIAVSGAIYGTRIMTAMMTPKEQQKQNAPLNTRVVDIKNPPAKPDKNKTAVPEAMTPSEAFGAVGYSGAIHD
jgi:hypothetical protein